MATTFTEKQADAVEDWSNWAHKKAKWLFRFTTIIIKAYVVSDIDANDKKYRDNLILEMKHDIDSFRSRFALAMISFDESCEWRSGFEIELLGPKNKDKRYKRETILDISNGAIDIKSIKDNERVLILHIHMIVYTTFITKAKLFIGKLFSLRWQTMSKRLYESQTTITAVSKIASYTFKECYKYSITNDNDETEVVGDLEYEWIVFLGKIYNGIDLSAGVKFYHRFPKRLLFDICIMLCDDANKGGVFISNDCNGSVVIRKMSENKKNIISGGKPLKLL